MILNIPDKVLLRIFRNLSTQDLLQNVALVNKKLNQISKDSDLLRIIVLKDIDEYVYQQVENVLAKARKLQKLTFEYNVLNSEKLIQIAVETSKDLKSLEIIGNVSEDFTKAISIFGQQIENLDVSEIKIEHDGLMHLTKLKNLKYLKINSFNFYLKSEHVQSLSLNCRQLGEVEFSTLSLIKNEILEEFCKTMETSLKKLSFYHMSEIKWTFASLGIMERLTTLNIDFLQLRFTEDQIGNLAKIPNLEVFSLIGSGSWNLENETTQNLVKLFTQMNLENLKTLIFETKCNPIIKTIHKIISDSVDVKLQRLQLQCSSLNCSLDCETSIEFEIENLTKVLEKCVNLKELSICGKDLPQTLLLDIKHKHGIRLNLDKFCAKALESYSKSNMPVSLIKTKFVQEEIVILDEVLLKIFRCLYTKDILKNIALVCKQFYRLSKDPVLFQVVELHDIHTHEFEIVEIFLKRATKLKTLSLMHSVHYKEFLLSTALRNSKELKTIAIWSKITKELAYVMLEHGKQIQDLDMVMNYQKLDPETFLILTKIDSLKSIRFCVRPNLKPKHLEAIASNCKNLEHLVLHNITRIPAYILEEFFEEMKNRLRNLEFQMHSPTFSWTLNSLTKLELLTRLDVYIGEKVLNEEQIENLAKIPNLKEFHFSADASSDVNDNNQSLIKFFTKLKMENLEKLELDLECQLDVYEIHKVVIGRLGKNLQSLTLSCHPGGCSDECPEDKLTLDIDQVKTILMKCPKLRYLNISGKHLPERFLCEIKSKFNLKLVVDMYKRKAMKRFKIVDPRFHETMMYF